MPRNLIPGTRFTRAIGSRPLSGSSRIVFSEMMDSTDPFSVWSNSACASTVIFSLT